MVSSLGAKPWPGLHQPPSSVAQVLVVEWVDTAAGLADKMMMGDLLFDLEEAPCRSQVGLPHEIEAPPSSSSVR